MQSVGGIFASYKDGERAAERLHARGFSADHLNIALPTDEAQAAAAREVLGDSVAPPALS